MSDISSRGYFNSDVLVSTDWVEEHLQDSTVRIVELKPITICGSDNTIEGKGPGMSSGDIDRRVG